jgi:hypothetical protein
MNNFNLDKCHARLAKNINSQCANDKKFGNLCGTHNRLSNVKLITDSINNTNSSFINQVNNDSPINLPTKYKSSIHKYQYQDLFNNIVKLQSIFKGYYLRKLINYHGIATFKRNLINNDTDFLTFESISNIPNYELFTYKDENNIYWGFHIATFKELIKTIPVINPYNTLLINDNIIKQFNKLIQIIENKNNTDINITHDVIIDPKITLQQRCITVFQKMDNLKQYTQCEWFLDLNIERLKQLYKFMEDMWSYRIGLTPNQRVNYVNNGKLFNENLVTIYRITDKLKLSNMILNEYDRLLNEGISESHKTTASLWILSGLTLVSHSARIAMPWLYESAVG